jgi:hypothetical protein
MSLPGFTAEDSLYRSANTYFSNSFTSSSGNVVLPAWNCGSKCKWYQPDCKAWKALWCTREGKFARCMGFPNPAEASLCLSAIPGCAVTAAGGPVPYGACLGALCGTAGAKHGYRCAKEAGFI